MSKKINYPKKFKTIIERFSPLFTKFSWRNNIKVTKGQVKPKRNRQILPKKTNGWICFFFAVRSKKAKNSFLGGESILANLLTVLSDLYKYFFKLLDQTYSKFVLSLNSPPKPQSNQFLILFFCKLLAINLPSGSTNSVLQRLVSNHKLG